MAVFGPLIVLVALMGKAGIIGVLEKIDGWRKHGTAAAAVAQAKESAA